MVAVGDELLSGLVANTNATRLGRALTGVGLRLRTVLEVGDDLDEIATALRAAARRGGVVVVTGGLGPTGDDITRQALAAAAGVRCHRDRDVVDRLCRWYADRGQDTPEVALRQADVPDGASLVTNPRGSAPGLRLGIGDSVVYALPGVPAELDAMLDDRVLGELAALAGAGPRPVTRVVRVALTGESAVAAAVDRLRLPGGVAVAYLAEPGQVRVRVTGVDAPAVTEAAQRVAGAVGDAAYSTDDEDLDAAVHRLLGARGATVAAAESLTGGLVAAALTERAGASATFRGGVVTYATEAKADLGVDPALLAAVGPVDAEVAGQLAAAARSRFVTTHGVATTGVAGPERVGGHPVGTVFVAVDAAGARPVTHRRLPGDRALVRRLATVHALDLLRRVLLDLPPCG